MVTDGSPPGRSPGPRILAPEVQRACAPLVLRVVGLPAGTAVRIRAVTVDRLGRPWCAEAAFRSKDTVVDVARDASTSGSYLGVDPDGLLTTMRPAGSRTRTGGRFSPSSPSGFLVSFDVRGGDDVVATSAITRVLVDPEVTVRQVLIGGEKVGAVWHPPHGRLRRPPVVVLAPARSSMAAYAPGLLASRGYLTAGITLPAGRLGLLAPWVSRLRLEDLRQVLVQGVAQGGVDVHGAVLLGVAGGAELALQVAADLPDPGAVVAYLPARRPRRTWLARARTLRFQRTCRDTRLDRIDARLLVVAAGPDEALTVPRPAGNAGLSSTGDDRWVSTAGWQPLGPGRLPGDAQGGSERHVGGEAWDLVLELVRSLSISNGPSLTEGTALPVRPPRQGQIGPGRSAR